jgi:hypothetical protein
VGGLAVGEGQETMFEVLDYAPAMLPEDRPRYLMGVGKPDDIVGAVARGIDMMDCVLPTRSGRTGQAFTRRGVVNLRNARHRDDPRPLDEGCACPACRSYSRAYLHHCVRTGEIIGVRCWARSDGRIRSIAAAPRHAADLAQPARIVAPISDQAEIGEGGDRPPLGAQILESRSHAATTPPVILVLQPASKSDQSWAVRCAHCGLHWSAAECATVQLRAHPARNAAKGETAL